MTRDIIDAIDHALRGDTGPDAMRWTPDPPPPDQPEREGQSVSWVEYDETTLFPVAPTPDELGAAFDPLGTNRHDIIVVLQPHFGRFVEIMAGIGELLAAVFAEIRRNGPLPLTIDGHEYRRRTRARRKRTR